MLGGTAKDEVALGGTRRDEDAIEGAYGTPGRRAVRPGKGGGGISSVSVRTRGTEGVSVEVSLPARWALVRLGNAGGTSLSPNSSSDPRMVAASSSSSSTGANSTMSGGAGVADAIELKEGIQLRR